MNLRKTTAINLRMAPDMKEMLRLAAEKEHRTLSNMLETLILSYCHEHGIVASTKPPTRQRREAKKKADAA